MVAKSEAPTGNLRAAAKTCMVGGTTVVTAKSSRTARPTMNARRAVTREGIDRTPAATSALLCPVHDHEVGRRDHLVRA